jgi:hypothetical protein
MSEHLWGPAVTAESDYRADRARDAWRPRSDLARAHDEGWDEYVERRAAQLEAAIQAMRPANV